jgi:hypothetical protein
MSELERKLQRTGAEVEYPPTPALAATVTERLRAEGVTAPVRPLRRPPTLRIALVAAAIFLLLAGGVVAAVPAARHAVLDLVGLRGATVIRVPYISGNVEAHPGLAVSGPISLESAQRELSFDPLLPADLGEPDGVFTAAEYVPPGGELILTYAPRPGLPLSRYTGVGLLIDEINGNFAPGFFGKMIPRGVPIERLRIDGHYAIWIEGLHEFHYKDAATHIFRIGTARLAGNTLLVQRGPVMVRIEGKFGRAKAIEIARSLRHRQ